MTAERVGPYEILQLLAQGGMAEIFLARRVGPGGFEKRVVIKRIAKKLLGDGEIEAMFMDEARVQALLDHPHIVQIYDFGEDDGNYYIAMEFVAGATLRWFIDNARAKGRVVPLHHALRIMADVLGALHYAHVLEDDLGQPLGVIHRDISPVNVLVARTGHAKLCDFGVAKSQLQTHLTRVGIVKGKFRYMSPEQLCGEPIDRRVDVFGVGVCFWELLTGRRLFHHKDEGDVVRAIRSGAYPRPSSLRSDLPKAVDRLLRKALQRDPAERFDTAREFELSCEELLKHLPKGSTSALLSRYARGEIDGRAENTRVRTATHRIESVWESGFEALDPPVPGHDDEVPLEDEQTIPRTEGASTLTRAASLALSAPAGAFAGVAKTAKVVENALRRGQTDPEVNITRSTSGED